MSTQFIREHEKYERKFDILDYYVHNNATLLSRKYGKSYEECVEFIKNTIAKDGKRPMSMPNARVLMRGENGDRERVKLPFMSYINHLRNKDYIVSPTMAAYERPERVESLCSKMTLINVDKRSAVKKLEKQAIIDKDAEAEAFNNVKQTTFKIKNNSLSGAHASKYTYLFNKSAHSTLTSTCRTMTTTNNAHSERFIAGNRHYYNLAVTIDNINTIAFNTDTQQVARVIAKYSLSTPSVDEVYESIHRSASQYWDDPNGWIFIRETLEALTIEELTAFHWCSDLYNQNKTNPEFIQTMLTRLATKVTEGEDTDVNPLSGDVEEHSFIGAIFIDEMRGESIPGILKNNPVVAKQLRMTYSHFLSVMDEYYDYLMCFLATDFPPASIANFTSSIRKCVPLSDTDSTVYTVQDWVKDKFGGYKFTQQATAYGAAVAYLNNKLTGHWLAMLSRQMGVPEKYQTRLSMKPEFAFPVMFSTTRAKHYAMRVSAREGIYYEEPELELKGVGFRSSKVPGEIRQAMIDLIEYVMDQVEAEAVISPVEILTRVADTERSIINSITQGDVKYLSTAQVKAADSYSDPSSGAYKFKLAWDHIFGPVYGPAPEPPYQAVKVSLKAKSPTIFNRWVDQIEDGLLRDRFRDWFKRNSKGVPGQFLVPAEIAVNGIPKELILGTDIRRLVLDLMNGTYIALESLGIFELTTNGYSLISDKY